MAKYLDGAGLATLWGKIKAADTAVVNSFPKFQFGTYTGANADGSTNALSLTFSFVPKMVFIHAGSVVGVFTPASLTSSYKSSGYAVNSEGGGSSDYAKFSGTTLSWYSTYNKLHHLNSGSTVYQWFAIG